MSVIPDDDWLAISEASAHTVLLERRLRNAMTARTAKHRADKLAVALREARYIVRVLEARHETSGSGRNEQ